MIRDPIQSKYNGFTLVETLLYLSITSVLILSVSILLGVTLNAKVENRAKIEVQQQAQFISDHIDTEVKKASEISSPSIGNSGNTLTIQDSTNSKQYEYSISGGTLYFQTDSDPLIELSNSKVNISSLIFSNNNNTLSYEITLTYINSDKIGSINYSTTHQGSITIRK